MTRMGYLKKHMNTAAVNKNITYISPFLPLFLKMMVSQSCKISIKYAIKKNLVYFFVLVFIAVLRIFHSRFHGWRRTDIDKE